MSKTSIEKKSRNCYFLYEQSSYKTLSGQNYIFHRFILLPKKDEQEDLVNNLKSQKILAKPVYAANTDTVTGQMSLFQEQLSYLVSGVYDIDDLDLRIRGIL